MRFAEGVSARDQGHGLLVVHRHARERLPNISCCSHGVGLAVGSFRVHVNQAHLHGRKRILKLAVAACSARLPATCLPAPQ